jgi:hypothetical protein
VEAESAIVLTSTHGEVEGFARRNTLLKGKLLKAHQARDTAEENSWGLFVMVADAKLRQDESERELPGKGPRAYPLQT